MINPNLISQMKYAILLIYAKTEILKCGYYCRLQGKFVELLKVA